MKQFIHNPVLNKELKLRFRTGKSFLGILFYLLAIGLIMISFIYTQSFSSGAIYFRPEESRFMFTVLSILQLILILFITPGLTAAVISTEREKQTLNILLTTTQSSANIILGKLFSSIAYLLLLLLSSLPLYSLVFLFGGISPMQLINVFSFYFITILGCGSLGVFFSTIFRKTIVSIITTYSIMLFLSLGLMIFYYFITMISHELFPNATFHIVPYLIAVPNPYIALMSIIDPTTMEDMQKRFFGINVPIWIPYVLFYLALFIISCNLSIRKLRPKMKVKKKG